MADWKDNAASDNIPVFCSKILLVTKLVVNASGVTSGKYLQVVVSVGHVGSASDSFCISSIFFGIGHISKVTGGLCRIGS